MTTEAVHPAGGTHREAGGLVQRIADVSYRLSYLGCVGVLSLFDGLFAPLEYTGWFFLFFLLYLVAAVGWMVNWTRRTLLSGASREASVDAEPASWITHGYRLDGAKMVVASVIMVLQPLVILQSLLQFIGSGLVRARHLGSLRDPQTHESDVSYRLPFEGTWTVLNGSPDRSHSHSWSLPQQRYAYDFVVTDEEGRTHNGGTGPATHHCWAKPILAPADGTVVAVRDGHRDYHRTTGWVDPLQYRLAGNYVLIKHDDNEFSFLAHLKQGSVSVSVGDSVERGEQIGLCGNSGNSSEPHLHFSIQNRPSFLFGASLPVQFSDVTVRLPDEEPQSHERGYIHCGQLVSPSNRIDGPALDALERASD